MITDKDRLFFSRLSASCPLSDADLLTPQLLPDLVKPVQTSAAGYILNSSPSMAKGKKIKQ